MTPRAVFCLLVVPIATSTSGHQNRDGVWLGERGRMFRRLRESERRVTEAHGLWTLTWSSVEKRGQKRGQKGGQKRGQPQECHPSDRAGWMGAGVGEWCLNVRI